MSEATKYIILIIGSTLAFYDAAKPPEEWPSWATVIAGSTE